MVRRKELINGIYATLTIKVRYRELKGQKVKTGIIQGKASSFAIKDDFQEVRKNALLNALIIFENERGYQIKGTNELTELNREMSFEIVDYYIDYKQKIRYKDEMREYKFKRVKRRGRYYTYIFNPDGKLETLKRWKPLTQKRVDKSFSNDFEDLGIEEDQEEYEF